MKFVVARYIWLVGNWFCGEWNGYFDKKKSFGENRRLGLEKFEFLKYRRL